MKRLVTFLLATLIAGCGARDGRVEPEATVGSAQASPAGAGESAPTGSLPASGDSSVPSFAGSIYDLNVTLTDQDGRQVSLDTFRGHPVLVAMFYARCAGACPVLTTDLKRIYGGVAPSVRENLRVLMVSFDSTHDTPEVLSRVARERGLDAHWKLANAAEDEARELAAVLGVKYRRLDSGAYFHSSVITLLDGTGRPQARTEGLGKDPAPFLFALR